MISMQKDLSTVSFVYLAASALSSDCVYLINVYKAKRNKITDPQSQDTTEHVLCHDWVGGHSNFTNSPPYKACRFIKKIIIKVQAFSSSKWFLAISARWINLHKYEKDVISFLCCYLNFYSKQLFSLYEKYPWFLPEVKVLCKTSCETWIIPFFKASLFRSLEILAEKEFQVKK